MLYISGEIGIIPGTGNMIAGGIKPETRQLMENINAILMVVNSSMDDIVECTCLMADLKEYDDFNSVYETYFKANAAPSRAAFSVVQLPKDARAEVKCSAMMGAKPATFL